MYNLFPSTDVQVLPSSSGKYWFDTGSLTTSPCTGGVNWFVSQDMLDGVGLFGETILLTVVHLHEQKIVGARVA
jgi:hypothetical protein